MANASDIRVIINSLAAMKPHDGKEGEKINGEVVLAVFEIIDTFVNDPEASQQVQEAFTCTDRELFQRSIRTLSGNNRVQKLGKNILEKCGEWFVKADEKRLQLLKNADTVVQAAVARAKAEAEIKV